MQNCNFRVGDKVRKVKGYPFVGTVCAVYPDEPKCNVKHKDGWEHIFNNNQLAIDHPEYQYLDLLADVLNNGEVREGRNGNTRSVFGRQIRFDLRDSFPLITTKRVHFRSVVGELLWFLTGATHIKYLRDNNITIWDEWAADDLYGSVGNLYGAQWRFWMAPSKASFVHDEKFGADEIFVKQEDQYRTTYKSIRGTYTFGTIDQIQNVIDSLKADRFGRRHIVTAWNPDDVNTSALPPCHILFQFYVSNDNKLSCHLYQRSADLFLGVPFNIASYALLTQLIAREVGMHVGELVHTFGDVHLYENHIEQATEQLTRTPYPTPYVVIDTNKKLFDLEIDDIKLMHYNSHPIIKAPVSV